MTSGLAEDDQESGRHCADARRDGKCTFCVQRIEQAKIARGEKPDPPATSSCRRFIHDASRGRPAGAIVLQPERFGESRSKRKTRSDYTCSNFFYQTTPDLFWQVRNPNLRCPITFLSLSVEEYEKKSGEGEAHEDSSKGSEQSPLHQGPSNVDYHAVPASIPQPPPELQRVPPGGEQPQFRLALRTNRRVVEGKARFGGGFFSFPAFGALMLGFMLSYQVSTALVSGATAIR